MNAILRFSGAGKRDPLIEEWLNKTDGCAHCRCAHVVQEDARVAHLDDPAGLLEGTGRNMRHVKLRPGHEPDSVALGNLLDASYLDVKMRLRAE